MCHRESLERHPNCPRSDTKCLRPLVLIGIRMLVDVLCELFHIDLGCWLIPFQFWFDALLPGEERAHADTEALTCLERGQLLLFLDGEHPFSKVERIHLEEMNPA